MSSAKKEQEKPKAVEESVTTSAETVTEESGGGIEGRNSEGSVRIAEEVIAQLATQALLKVEGVQPASPGLVANLRIGKKASGGVRISVEEGVPPVVLVDAYVTTKYGMRIPDAAWDVQESIKKSLEQFTGYGVKAVNVYVQGVYFEEEQTDEGPERSPAGGKADTSEQQ
ncbi:MAG: Asp23/Gls24 family envelope stress response protein [Synergistota bacterium]|nr:Asp23/Gls24 family envelope stress response protein [Synergistota bacterium]